MLFTDPVFLLGFLPATLVLFYLGKRYFGGRFSISFLLFASAVFYGYWSIPFLGLLVSQILINYVLARRLNANHSRKLLWLGISFNLLLLGYFKYRNFFLENLSLLAGWHLHLAALFVPLGISFHTFQQITYLTDITDGEDEVPPLPQYILFVLFFPQLIAGPVVMHPQMGGQLTKLSEGKVPNPGSFGPGIVLFALGLFKKVCLADSLAPFVDAAFQWPQHLHALEAWSATAGYALQLFFDFSGYSDMAIGLGLMFGLLLPVNFNIPYAATSIREYWMRWHITMTRFFTMYCYSPLALAASRRMSDRKAGPLSNFLACIAMPTIVTFLASGLWHGAGWTFILFGLVHGIGLTVNHAWREVKMPKPPPFVGWLLTALVVLVGATYFRSGSVAQAHAILGAMFKPGILTLPNWTEGIANRLGIQVGFYELFQAANFTAHFMALLLLMMPLAVLLPNPSLKPLDIKPGWRTALAVAFMLWLTAGWIGEPRTFLYFQF